MQSGIGRDHYNSLSISSSTLFTLYVRKEGKDHFDGHKLNRPLQTIGAALKALPDKSDTGILIDIGPGIWKEDLCVPSIRFFGGRRVSRVMTARLGVDSNKSDFLGLVLRGTKGSFGKIGFESSKDYFAPVCVPEADGNSDKIYFSPATKIIGTISSCPSSMYELSCLDIQSQSNVHSYAINTYGSIVGLRGCVLKSDYCVASFESFSDIRMNGCVGIGAKDIKLRNMSILKLEDYTSFCDSTSIEMTDGSFLLKKDVGGFKKFTKYN